MPNCQLLIIVIIFHTFFFTLDNVKANASPFIDRDEPIRSIFFTFLFNLPLNFFMFIFLFRFLYIFKSNRKFSFEPRYFYLLILLCIIIITIVGALIDYNFVKFSVKDTNENLKSNLPALFLIFLSFFIPIWLVIKQTIFLSLEISLAITLINYLSWAYLVDSSGGCCNIIFIIISKHIYRMQECGRRNRR